MTLPVSSTSFVANVARDMRSPATTRRQINITDKQHEEKSTMKAEIARLLTLEVLVQLGHSVA